MPARYDHAYTTYPHERASTAHICTALCSQLDFCSPTTSVEVGIASYINRTAKPRQVAGNSMTGDNMSDELLGAQWYTTEEFACLIGVDASTIRRWRTSRPMQGPAFVQLSSRVTKYHADDIARWLRSHRVDPDETST